jgi:hypothetical protein
MGVYGLSGAGKTRLIASNPSTLILHPPTSHMESIDLPSEVHEYTLEDHNTTNQIFQWGQQGGFKKYDWVWIDDVSLFEDTGLDDVFSAAVDRKPDRADFGPDKGEYGINRGRIGRLIRDMVGLSKSGMFNFGWTAQVMEWTNPVTDEDLWVPQFGSPRNNQGMKLCGYMNIVAYLQAKDEPGKKRQELLLVDSEGFVGKDQYNCFPELKSGRRGFANPTMGDVESAILKKRRSKPSTTRKRTQRKRRK